MTCSDPAPESRLAKPIIVQSPLAHTWQPNGDTLAVGRNLSVGCLSVMRLSVLGVISGLQLHYLPGS